MAYLLNNVGLASYFDGVFCTCDIGFDKSQEEYWNFVFGKLNLQPEEIMFFDDRQENVDITKKLGMQAYFYNGIELLKDKIKQFI